MSTRRTSHRLSRKDTVDVYVGPTQRRFAVHRRLLRDSCEFFRDGVDAIPRHSCSSVSAESDASSHSSSSHSGDNGDDQVESSPASASNSDGGPMFLWLPKECPDMFELFVKWLHRPNTFRTHVNDTIASWRANRGAVPSCRRFFWALVRLHTFATLVELPALQDLTMDAVQDLHLHGLQDDWAGFEDLLATLYAEGHPPTRMRRWAVAMMAWMLAHAGSPAADAAGDDPDRLRRLFDSLPALFHDYVTHTEKTTACRANIRVKNPALRLQGNGLRADDRGFGYRRCTFHSHRRSVGQEPCPHAAERERERGSKTGSVSTTKTATTAESATTTATATTAATDDSCAATSAPVSTTTTTAIEASAAAAAVPRTSWRSRLSDGRKRDRDLKTFSSQGILAPVSSVSVVAGAC